MRNLEERIEGLRRSDAYAQLNREQISEMIAITANLIKERKRIRVVLPRLPESRCSRHNVLVTIDVR